MNEWGKHVIGITSPVLLYVAKLHHDKGRGKQKRIIAHLIYYIGVSLARADASGLVDESQVLLQLRQAADAHDDTRDGGLSQYPPQGIL